MNWSQKLIDLAGGNFDILGFTTTSTSRENYATGSAADRRLPRRSCGLHRASAHPRDRARPCWSGDSRRTYDWRAGLHAAGSLILYEKLSPALAMTSPALLMRNTTDDPSGGPGFITITSRGFRARAMWRRSCFAITTRNGPCLHLRHLPGPSRPQAFL